MGKKILMRSDDSNGPLIDITDFFNTGLFQDDQLQTGSSDESHILNEKKLRRKNPESITIHSIKEAMVKFLENKKEKPHEAPDENYQVFKTIFLNGDEIKEENINTDNIKKLSYIHTAPEHNGNKPVYVYDELEGTYPINGQSYQVNIWLIRFTPDKLKDDEIFSLIPSLQKVNH